MHKGIRMRYAVARMFCMIALLCLTGCSVTVAREQTMDPQGERDLAEGGLEESMDKVLRPQDDYYGYINRTTLQNYELNHFSEGAGSFADVEKEVEQEIAGLLQELVNSKENYQPGSNEQLLRDAYLQTLEYLNGADSSARRCFETEAEEICSAGTVTELKKMITTLSETQGINLIFSPGVTKHIYRTGEYMACFSAIDQVAGYALEDIYEKDSTRQELYSFAVNILMIAGENRETAKEKAKTFVYDMIAVAENTNFENLEAANPWATIQVMSADQINASLTNYSIQELTELYGMQAVQDWGIQDPEQMKSMDALFAEDKLESLKTYMLCSLAYEYRDFLRKEYTFFDTFQEAREPEKMALVYVGQRFSEQLSEIYAAAYYTEEMEADLLKMYEDINTGYRKLIREADWLSLQTREGLLQKLENMVLICGNSEQGAEPENADMIGEDAFATFLRVNRRKNNDRLQLLGTKVDRTEPSMASYMVNASYDPINNSFTIAVAILHAPFYSPEQTYAENLGGLGDVMCHEIGHAFDSNCLNFDAEGVYRPEWVCEEDRAELNRRLSEMETYYSAFTVMDIYHVDGAKTSGENYADKGAMECLMTIVTNPKQQEELFTNYARVWCSLLEDNYAIGMLQEDEHSPDRVRTNAVLSATEEFYEVYGVKPGDGMYIPPEQRVSRWK